MTPTLAIAKAQGRVMTISYGRGQYKVKHWSPERNAWWEDTITDRYKAQATAWELKVEIALEYLGIDDAGYLAFTAHMQHAGKDWRAVVREIYQKELAARERSARWSKELDA